MNWQAIRAVVRKDLMVLTQSKGVLIPLIVVPVVLLVLMPVLFIFLPQLEALSPNMGIGTHELLAQLPPELGALLAEYDAAQQLVLLMTVYYMAPLYLILPLMVASVVAADSIAGEKERRTLEALLYSPTTDIELFTAKYLSALVPAVGVAWFGFLLYTLVVNLAAWPVMGQIFFPTQMWLLLAFWVAPAAAALGLGTTVIISARVNSFQEAYQLGGVIVTPVIALVIAQAAGVIYFSSGLVFGLGLLFWLVDGLLLWFGGKLLRRDRLAARL
jgi:ABC-2 type transport system permease protein